MKPARSGILVFRFSAMGDVAMTAPVLAAFRQQYPDIPLGVVSRNAFTPFFADIPQLSFHSLEPKGRHKGLTGLFKLFLELNATRPKAVADLHNNLRSRILGLFFFFCGVPVIRVEKAREEKKQLTRKNNKVLRPLLAITERYAGVFGKLGFPVKLSHQLPPKNPQPIPESLIEICGDKTSSKWIGVSPFAQHSQKVYPAEKMYQVILQLAEKGYQLFIFGGGHSEQTIAAEWAAGHPGIKSLIGKVNLEQELALISNLDLMISMDSSGMHLASLKGIPVVSVWGATHPFTGFLGYGQSLQDAVQLDLYCRPCSVYGNKPCYRGDFACMNNLPESVVIQTVIKKLKNE